MDNVPDTLQVHGSDFHHVANFLALENTVTSPSSHASHIEQLRAVDHMVICSTGTLATELVPGVSSASYLLASRHKRPWLQPESKGCPRLPREWPSPEASFLVARSDLFDQIGAVAGFRTHDLERSRFPCNRAAKGALAS
jgi:hypothetical protein